MVLNINFVTVVMLIVDLADYLLEHVFDSYQTRNTTVFVNYHCHMTPVLAKLLEQYIQTFAFGNK